MDSLAEYAAFRNADPSGAQAILAVLIATRNYGTVNIPAHHHPVNSHRVRCAQSSGWAAFYAVSGPVWGPAQVSVVLVADVRSSPFNALVTEAWRRKSQFGL